MIAPEFFRLWRGEQIRESIARWENPLSVYNLKQMVRNGDAVGQMTFGLDGEFDVIYFMKGKNESCK